LKKNLAEFGIMFCIVRYVFWTSDDGIDNIVGFIL